MGKAIRDVYGESLAKYGQQNTDVVVFDADVSGSTKSATFATVCPDRFFNMGIAECNMVGVAAGMAAAGLKPFTNTFAMFAAGRAYEQVRNSVAYPGLNVVCVGTHGGVSVGEDGATHQCIEDLALMRAIPRHDRHPPLRRLRDRAGRGCPAGVRRPRLPAPVPAQHPHLHR